MAVSVSIHLGAMHFVLYKKNECKFAGYRVNENDVKLSEMVWEILKIAWELLASSYFIYGYAAAFFFVFFGEMIQWTHTNKLFSE